MSSRTTMKNSRLRRAAAAVALSFCALMALGAASASASNLQADIAWFPTHLPPGETAQVRVKLFNYSNVASVGTTTTVAQLPPGVIATSAGGGAWSCGGLGTEAVTCTISASIPPHFTIAEIRIGVDVDPGASGAFPTTVTVSGGGSQTSVTSQPTTISSTPAKFGVNEHSMTAAAYDVNGNDLIQASGRPYEATTSFTVNNLGSIRPGQPKDVIVDLPPGLIGDPLSTAKCSQGDFRANDCPPGSQVGIVFNNLGAISPEEVRPIYNLIPPANAPAAFGFLAFGTAEIKILADLRTDTDYSIQAIVKGIPEEENTRFFGGRVTFWGDPSDPRHDPLRGLSCIGAGTIPTICSGGNESAGTESRPFFALPNDCNVTNPIARMHFDSWENPAPDFLDFSHPAWANYDVPVPPVSGCEFVPFDPSIGMQLSTPNSDSPTGMSVRVKLPQNFNPDGLATAHLKKAVVTLPEGMTINPAAADGLSACSSAQIGMTSPAPDAHFARGDSNCPQGSKIATAEVSTHLLEEPLVGDVYQATPYDNPFGSLFAIYIVLRGPNFVVKLPGLVEADPVTGQLKTTFDQNPQTPFHDFKLNFFGGPRAPLATSPTCGTKTIASEFTPWTAPQSGPPALRNNSYTATQGPAGTGCSNSMDSRPFAPKLEAGTSNPIAGAFSPLTMRLTRPDGHQELAGLTVKPPRGFTAVLKGVASCSEAQLAAAGSRSGEDEYRSPSCPASSQIGRVLTGAGAGPTPLFSEGRAYLSGPYKGAPLSMAVITPAIAGGSKEDPVFDLGTVVVRVALHVDSKTAQVTAVSDPVPQILKGVPLRIKDIRVHLDRPQWGVNPTSCTARSFDVSATGQSGASANLSDRFQVGDCSALPLKPKFHFRLKGGTGRGAHPAFTATVTARPGDANIARVAATVPRSEFLDQAHIRTICTRVQFAADACPAAAIYGSAKAVSPLLDEPLQGPVYLRSSNNKLPDLVAALKGPASQPIEIELVGRVDSIRGQIRTTFESIPDAPVSKFTLSMQGGRKGLLVNSKNICKGTFRANVKVDGHNGGSADQRPKMNAECRKGKRKREKSRRG